MSEPSPDDRLVEAAQNAAGGDYRSFEELVRRHQGHVMANCRHLSGSSTDAEDLAQEVFAKAYFALNRFEGRSNFRTWLQRIKINHCLNFIKKRDRARTSEFDEEVSTEEALVQRDPDAQRHLEQKEQKAHVERALERMPESLRVPLIMCDLDMLPYQEIAKVLGIGLSAVKMRIKRGREEFRRHFDAEDTCSRQVRAVS